MNNISTLPPDYAPREKVKEWYTKLYQKPANYVVDGDDLRQLSYELEQSYNTFMATLKGNK